VSAAKENTQLHQIFCWLALIRPKMNDDDEEINEEVCFTQIKNKSRFYSVTKIG
jgi:hypothetical protein